MNIKKLPELHQAELKDVSVIIATRNEGRHLKACLDSVLAASKGEAEIIVVDDGSTDDTEDILKNYDGKIINMNGGGQGPGHARNLAVKETEKYWVAFTDGDCEVQEDWLEKLCEGITGRSSEYVSIGGVQEISHRANKQERKIGEFLNSLGFVSDYLHGAKKIIPVKHNPTCNVLYWKESVKNIGGFDESLWPCEDLDLDLRFQKKGLKALFNPNASVEHRRPSSIGAFLKMMRRYGFAHAQLTKKHGLCQPIHALPLIVAIGSVMILFFRHDILELIKNHGVHFLLTVVALCVLFMTYRSQSILNGFRFTWMLPISILLWLIGYFSGALGRRRIAKAHG